MHAPVSIPEITPTELKQRLDGGDGVVLVDVREPHEARIADLPEIGQLRIPLGDFVQRHREIDPDREVVVYCRSGARSGQAVAFLMQSGFEHALNLKGGVLGWRTEVDPTLAAY